MDADEREGLRAAAERWREYNRLMDEDHLSPPEAEKVLHDNDMVDLCDGYLSLLDRLAAAEAALQQIVDYATICSADYAEKYPGDGRGRVEIATAALSPEVPRG